MEQPRRSLDSLDFVGITKNFSPTSVEFRNRQILLRLENPPGGFDERQELLDMVPDYIWRLHKDLFVSVQIYLREALDVRAPEEDIPEVVEELKRRKLVPVLRVSEAGKINGHKQRVVRYKVLRSDFEKAIERRQRMQA